MCKGARMIYDVIPFFNELAVLELRMNILDPYVDFFVVNESPVTFTGHPKPLYFEENKDKFKKFESKIIHNVTSENNPQWNQWERELCQKGSMLNGFYKQANDEDLVFLSDTDEIWNPETIDFDKVKDTNKLYICHQLFFHYFLNCVAVIGENIPYPWEGTRLSTWKLLKRNSTDTFRNPNSGFQLHSQSQIERIPWAGWHFSFLNGPEAVKYKINSWSHQEFNTPNVINNVEENVKNLRDVFGRNQFEIKPIQMTADTHPKYLLDNLEKYEQYLYKK